MYRFIFAAMLVFAVQASAMANGGGNTKSNGSIKVTNGNSSLLALVAINPSESLIASTTLSEFTSRGGRVINAGGNTVFSGLKAGKYNMYFILVTSTTTSVNPSSFGKREITVNTNRQTSTTVNVPSSSSASSN